jgi:hypothetical protein
MHQEVLNGLGHLLAGWCLGGMPIERKVLDRVFQLPAARSERDARAAVLSPEGCVSYVIVQEQKFLLLNPLEGAGLAASDAKAECARHEQSLQVLERKLAWTPATIPAPPKAPNLTWPDLAIAAVLAGVGVTGLIVSNVVLSHYVLASASDLFANNPLGAGLFATLPCLGAVALKVFQQKLESANARWFLDIAAFVLGTVSLAVWLAASAVAFAPDTGGSAALLAESRGGNLVGMALLVSTVLCDITLGFTILSGIGQSLSGPSRSVPSPAYAILRSEKRRLERVIVQCRRRHASAQDYLNRAEVGRAATRHEAERDIDRARELWSQAKGAVQASATATFLSTEGEDMRTVLRVLAVSAVLFATQASGKDSNR